MCDVYLWSPIVLTFLIYIANTESSFIWERENCLKFAYIQVYTKNVNISVNTLTLAWLIASMNLPKKQNFIDYRLNTLSFLFLNKEDVECYFNPFMMRVLLHGKFDYLVNIVYGQHGNDTAVILILWELSLLNKYLLISFFDFFDHSEASKVNKRRKKKIKVKKNSHVIHVAHC